MKGMICTIKKILNSREMIKGLDSNVLGSIINQPKIVVLDKQSSK